MDETRFGQRKEEFEKAILRLKEAFAEPQTQLARDGIIHRFEFCYELAWKTAKLYLESKDIDVRNAKDTLKEAFQQGLIEDGDLWSAIHKYRNLTSHTYDEATAIEVYEFVKNQSLVAFEALLKKLNAL